MRVAIYGRTSTTKQNVENQMHELRNVAHQMGWTISYELMDEGISGAKGRKERPNFDVLFNLVEQKKVDMIMAWSVDRIGRSLQDLVALMHSLEKNSVNLYCHQQALNTATPSGKMILGIFAVVGEYERSIIIERIKAGISRAKKDGIKFGRPRIYDNNMRKRAIELKDSGMTVRQIAKITGLGSGSVWRMAWRDNTKLAIDKSIDTV